MRCLTLACALRERGGEVVFVSRELPGHLLERLTENDFLVKRLEQPVSDPLNQDLSGYEKWLGVSGAFDAQQTRVAIESINFCPDWLIVDHYALDQSWHATLRPFVGQIMVIDDLADRCLDCDLLLDQNYVCGMHSRYTDKVPSHCDMLLGPGYTLLQPAYAELHRRTVSREGAIRRILIYFGAADSDNLTARALSAFFSLGRADINIDVVLNGSSRHIEGIRQLVASHPNVQLHIDIPSLSSLMVMADIAIGAAGATSWERMCLGLPALIVVLAENQRTIAEGLSHGGYAQCLGHKDEVDESVIAQALSTLITKGVDANWSLACSALVDGNGAARVCSALGLRVSAPIQVRYATPADETVLLQWVPSSSPKSGGQACCNIELASNQRWFRNCLRNLEAVRCYIVETTDGVILGQVFFKNDNQTWRASYAFTPVCREAGMRRSVLVEALLRARSDEPGMFLVNDLRHENPAKGRAEGITRSDKNNLVLSIAICSDRASWINPTVADLVLNWLEEGHAVTWVHDAKLLEGGDVCFFLSYGRIVAPSVLSKYKNNLIVHASDLPKGKGWSPMTWQIMEGVNRIPLTLFEAAASVDSGAIYKQTEIEFLGHELIDDLRAAVARGTQELCAWFVSEYPEVRKRGILQRGESTYYLRRRPEDSRLSIERSLQEQFNLLRTVDSENYPAWFEYRNKRFALKIEYLDD